MMSDGQDWGKQGVSSGLLKYLPADGSDVQLTAVIPVKITRHKFTRVIV